MDGDIRMGDDYYRHSVGSPEHYAAYERQFIALNGVDAAISGDPEASYEIDHAFELAYDRMVEEGCEDELAELRGWWRERGIQVSQYHLDYPEDWLGDDWWLSCVTVADREDGYEAEPF